MGIRPSKTVRDERAAALKPIFAHMALHRMTSRWVAFELGIPEKRLWAYKSGEMRIPPDFVQRVCKVIGLLPSFVPIPEPRDLYIQQPRTAKTPAKQSKRQPKGGRHGDHTSNPASRTDASVSERRVRPVRRAQRPTPVPPNHDTDSPRA